MQPLLKQTWILPEQCRLTELRHALEEVFPVKSAEVQKNVRSWFDTFDWRLYRKKRLLLFEEKSWKLLDFTGKKLQSLNTDEKNVQYSWQFPESPLRSALVKPLDIRALLEVESETVESTELQILNSDQKIVAFVTLQQVTNRSRGHQRHTIHLGQVRGYVKEFHQVAGVVRRFGCREQTDFADMLQFALQGSGRKPLDYGSGFNVQLQAQATSLEAVGCIYRSLLADMRANRQGVIEDRDSEFLHDLRVAVRRTRSGLALIKNVLDPEVTARFKKEFRYVGRITGPVRDLDVYLLCKERYQSRLPERLHEGLEYFFQDLAEKRQLEQKKLVQALQASQYMQILNDWERALDPEKLLSGGKNAEVPIVNLAGKIIHKRFRLVLRDGIKIHPDTPDHELHCLRIECKKLRYSLEFFASLYDPGQMKRLVGQLKKLQNNLGDFNDLSVQQEMLTDTLSKLKPGSTRAKEIAASIGGLMTDLARQHRQVRSHFEATFSHFASKENLALYHEIFG